MRPLLVGQPIIKYAGEGAAEGPGMKTLQPGDTLEGRYRIVKALDEGGMGIVFLAEHVLIKRRVAIKVLRQELTGDADVIERFMNEARAAGTLGHPNIVESTDMGFTRDGVPYIVFEFLEGSLMTDEIYRVGGMTARRALRIARQIASALHAAHAAGIVHRDLKTDNVFLVQKDEAVDHVKVLDFGVSRFLEADDDRSGGTRAMIVGTPEFMAPEQITSPANVDGRADIYGLGLILYESLTCRRAFLNDGDIDKLVERVLTETPAPLGLPGAPPGLEEMIFTKLLAKDPTARYQTMKEVESALEAFAGVAREGRDSQPLPFSTREAAAADPTAEDAPARPALAPQTTKPRRAWPLVGAVLLAAAGGGAMYQFQQQQSAAVATGPDASIIQTHADKLAAELDALVQASKLRVDGISQTPMLRAGIETDTATMRDMARGDFLFTPKNDEVLELFQVRPDASTVSLLRLPESGAPTLPLTGAGARVDSDGTSLRVTVSAPITRQSGGVGGAAVLANVVDLEPARQRAKEHAIAATLESTGAPIVLAQGDATGGAPIKVSLKTTPELRSANLVLSATLPAPKVAPGADDPKLQYAAFGLWAAGGALLLLYLVNLLRGRRER